MHAPGVCVCISAVQQRFSRIFHVVIVKQDKIVLIVLSHSMQHTRNKDNSSFSINLVLVSAWFSC